MSDNGQAKGVAKPLYIFVDEGGNLDFSPSGTKYFTLTGLTIPRQFPFDPHLSELRFDLLEQGLELECFHAAEDRQATRNRVFSVICHCLNSLRADSVIVEKRKTGPSFRADAVFYPRMMGHLLQYVLNGAKGRKVSEVIVITDRLPVAKKRNAIEKAVKTTLAAMLPAHLPYRVIHHDSKSCSGLQVADYLNWAIYRKWDSGDLRSYTPIQPAIHSEFDIFRRGTTIWY